MLPGVPKHVYLSGPMRGLPESNYPEFNRAAEWLRFKGHDVENPASNFGGDQDRTLAEYMELDLTNVITTEGVVLLPGWGNSVGANTEVLVAHALGHPGFQLSPRTTDELNEDEYEVSKLSLVPPNSLPYSTDPKPFDASINIEADNLINGARRGSYGHPLDDYTKVAKMVNALFNGMFREGKEFVPEQVPLLMIIVKLSREMHHPKRDNRVDIAGYAGVMQMIHDERIRRAAGG